MGQVCPRLRDIDKCEPLRGGCDSLSNQEACRTVFTVVGCEFGRSHFLAHSIYGLSDFDSECGYLKLDNADYEHDQDRVERNLGKRGGFETRA